MRSTRGKHEQAKAAKEEKNKWYVPDAAPAASISMVWAINSFRSFGEFREPCHAPDRCVPDKKYSLMPNHSNPIQRPMYQTQ